MIAKSFLCNMYIQFFPKGKQIWTYIFLLKLFLLLAPIQDVHSQDNQPMEQPDDSLSDPNLVNPQNRQGYGKNVPTQVLKKDGRKTSPSNSPSSVTTKQPQQKTIGEQTLQAALQLGVLVSTTYL